MRNLKKEIKLQNKKLRLFKDYKGLTKFEKVSPSHISSKELNLFMKDMRKFLGARIEWLTKESFQPLNLKDRKNINYHIKYYKQELEKFSI